MSDFAKDYVDVATRIAEFKKLYPEGSLQSEIVTMTDAEVVIRALAYRTADDARPGVGHAREVRPGTTPYTRNSELMVCETSAWGRALAALGIATKNGIATAEEVQSAAGRNQKPQAPAPSQVPAAASGGGQAASAATLDLEDDEQWAAVMAAVPGVSPAPAAPPDEPYRHHGPECPVHKGRAWKDTSRGPKCTANDGTREEPVWCKWQPTRKWLAAQEVAR